MIRGLRLGAAVSCACAGILCAILLAAPVAGADEGTGTDQTTTEPPVTEAPPTTTEPPPPASPVKRPKPRVRKIADGVTIGGLSVSGLSRGEARRALKRRFERPLALVVGPGRRMRVTPRQLGATLRLEKAVSTAMRVRSGFRVPLTVDVDRGKLSRLLAGLGRETSREPVDARLLLRHLVPFATKSHPGRRLNAVLAARAIVRTLKTHDRTPVVLQYGETKPRVTDADLGEVIVIRRESKKLYVYDGTKLERVIGVATGQSSYPTPVGHFEITTKQANPWWYPPQGSAWAEGKEPVPPGPGNPLGTRWLGISAPYIGLHGTPDAASIGYSASHGCVRMLIPDAEWLFAHVEVGTPVFILRA